MHVCVVCVPGVCVPGSNGICFEENKNSDFIGIFALVTQFAYGNVDPPKDAKAETKI